MDEEQDNLTPQQELFCLYYTKNGELFSNATLSYAEAYGFDLDSQAHDDGVTEYKVGEDILTYIDKEVNRFDMDEDLFNKLKVVPNRVVAKSSYKAMYDNCSTYGSRLIRNDKIQRRLQAIYLAMMDDDTIDSVLSSIISNPKAQHKDRIAAIKEYNALRARIVKKLDMTSMGEKIPTIDLETMAKAMAEELKAQKT
jgi:hypothetical protein